LSGWAITAGRPLGPKMALGVFLRTRDALPHRESIKGFANFDYYPGALPKELRRRCDLLLRI